MRNEIGMRQPKGGIAEDMMMIRSCTVSVLGDYLLS
jgi:hypothetical protein